MFSDPVRRYTSIGTDMLPWNWVCAPLSVKLTAGVNWLTQSERRLSDDTRSTLSVTVDSTATEGSIVHFCACADGKLVAISSAVQAASKQRRAA